MTKTGIICAMHEEVDKIVNAFNLIQTEPKLDYKIYQNDQIVLIESNIGKVASTLAATTLINKFNINQLINIGLAGALKPIPAGNAYLISSVSQHDALIPFEDYQQDMYQNIVCKVPDHINKIATLTSGDQFVTDSTKIKNDTDMVDMEGFAVAYVANRYNIPVTLIKGVSDDTNSSSEAELYKNLNIAMDQTIELLKAVLN